jgi:hypothetical protein
MCFVLCHSVSKMPAQMFASHDSKSLTVEQSTDEVKRARADRAKARKTLAS